VNLGAVASPDQGVVTAVALDADWVVVGLANARVHVFSARTGVLSRTLVGHASGVWAVWLVSESDGDEEEEEEEEENVAAGEKQREGPAESGGNGAVDVEAQRLSVLGLDLYPGEFVASPSPIPSSSQAAASVNESGSEGYFTRRTEGEEKEREKRKRRRKVRRDRPSDPGQASDGWGQGGALVISGGCDKTVKVWDVQTGYVRGFSPHPRRFQDRGSCIYVR
jgi:F-box and WD-40 domain protein CDC4